MGGEDFVDEMGDGFIARVTGDGNDFEIFGRVAMKRRGDFSPGFLQFWF